MEGDNGTAEDTVRFHSLYGEPSAQLVDFLHIERLRSRSELFDWSIDPHAHPGLEQVMLIFDGGADVTLDDETYDLTAPVAISTPSGAVHAFELEQDSSGFVVTLSAGHLSDLAMGTWIRDQLFGRAIVVPLDTDSGVAPRVGVASRVKALCEELLCEHDTIDTGRVPTMDALVQVILIQLARQVEQVAGPPRGPLRDRFREFRMAVEDHYTEHWPLQRYAELLYMSESSLNRVCRSAAGSTAFELIQARLELEARRRLIYTTAPIHRLAIDLGFLDPSYFSRFFRRRTGMAPNEFRRLHQPS
jgi:AraC family transcriptional activator of pobA